MQPRAGRSKAWGWMFLSFLYALRNCTGFLQRALPPSMTTRHRASKYPSLLSFRLVWIQFILILQREPELYVAQKWALVGHMELQLVTFRPMSGLETSVLGRLTFPCGELVFLCCFQKLKKKLTFSVTAKPQFLGIKARPVPQLPAANAGKFATRADTIVLRLEELVTVLLWM